MRCHQHFFLLFCAQVLKYFDQKKNHNIFLSKNFHCCRLATCPPPGPRCPPAHSFKYSKQIKCVMIIVMQMKMSGATSLAIKIGENPFLKNADFYFAQSFSWIIFISKQRIPVQTGQTSSSRPIAMSGLCRTSRLWNSLWT